MIDLHGHTVIVTGFPRSGTSMMMRMLEFAGIPIIADSKLKKAQHKHDPYGCLEMENVGTVIRKKKLKWTRNKAVKIVTPYASWYPIDRPLKAIFMLRDLTEIITSLLAMKNVWEEDPAASIELARGYLKHNNVPILFVKYDEVTKYPRSTALRVSEFLEADLNIDLMVKAVDPDARNLYKKDPTIIGHDMPEHIVRIDSEAYKDITVEAYQTVEDAMALSQKGGE